LFIAFTIHIETPEAEKTSSTAPISLENSEFGLNATKSTPPKSTDLLHNNKQKLSFISGKRRGSSEKTIASHLTRSKITKIKI
ncbi:unnamed protein product, partial [Rotaria sordida]